MKLYQDQSEPTQTPPARGLAALLDRGDPSGIADLDESADKFAVGPPGNVDALKGTTVLGQTQVTRAENFGDGKLSGLTRLQELSAECNSLLAPEPPMITRKMAVGISVAVLAGVLVCLLALQFMQNSTVDRRTDPIPSKSEVTGALTTADVTKDAPAAVKVLETVREKAAEEKPAAGDILAPESRRERPGKKSTPRLRLKSRLDPEVLYRLELSIEQADRIRTILDRYSKDPSLAEAQVRDLLTEEQNRRWQAIAP